MISCRCVAVVVLVALLSQNQVSGVCYDGYGCFSENGPFSDLPVPKKPSSIYPTFHLFKRSSNDHVIVNSSALLNVEDLVVVVHGFMGSFAVCSVWAQPIIDNLRSVRPNADILFVDWSQGAAMTFRRPYTQAASNTRVVASILAHFLQANPAFNPKKAYCIGFSLGAHVCGFTAKRMQAKWGRVTGLDPAKPHFDKDDPVARLDRTDADFVDVIHVSWLGLDRAIGSVDFWANGAKEQPGCYVRKRRSFFKSISDNFSDFASCSHERAPEMFAASIKPPSSDCSLSYCPCASMADWKAGKCPKCTNANSQTIGYQSINNPNRGNFFANTSPTAPFCSSANY